MQSSRIPSWLYRCQIQIHLHASSSPSSSSSIIIRYLLILLALITTLAPVNATSCTLCQGTESIPYPGAIAIPNTNSDTEPRSCAYVSIDAIFTPSSALICNTYYQFIGYKKCGCLPPPPTPSPPTSTPTTKECTLCPNGRYTSTPNNIFDESIDATCFDVEKYIRNYEQSVESCTSFQQRSIGKCLCVEPSNEPTNEPSNGPSNNPSNEPSLIPSSLPSISPTTSPTLIPSMIPSMTPSTSPTVRPTIKPSLSLSNIPSSNPTKNASNSPSINQDTLQPSSTKSNTPSSKPTLFPTINDSNQPSSKPTVLESYAPTEISSSIPTSMPTSSSPTSVPSRSPIGSSFTPTNIHTEIPTLSPSSQPSTQPSYLPTNQLSMIPTTSHSIMPSTRQSNVPTKTNVPTITTSTTTPTDQELFICTNIISNERPSLIQKANIDDEYNILQSTITPMIISLEIVMMDILTIDEIKLNLAQTLSTMISLVATGCSGDENDGNDEMSSRLLLVENDTDDDNRFKIYYVEFDNLEEDNERSCKDSASISSGQQCVVIKGTVKTYYITTTGDEEGEDNSTSKGKYDKTINERIQSLLLIPSILHDVAESNNYITNIVMHEIQSNNANDVTTQIVQPDLSSSSSSSFVTKPEFYITLSMVGTTIIALIAFIIIKKSYGSHTTRKFGILSSSHVRSDSFVPVYNDSLIPDANKGRGLEEEEIRNVYPESAITLFESQDGFEIQRGPIPMLQRENNNIFESNTSMGVMGFEINNSFEGKSLDEWIESIERGERLSAKRNRGNNSFDGSIHEELKRIMSSSLVDLDSESDSDVFEDVDKNSDLSF